ncbi:MAG: sulfatase-like hydrolase/transferase [Bacteroidales bacterium]|nr:sulfatase-like hydrolase/transferase [Bacteroidales bacterium]
MKRFFCYLLSTALLSIMFIVFTIARMDTMDTISWIYLIFSSISHASMVMLIPLVLSFIPNIFCNKKSNIPFWTMIALTALLFILVFIDANVYDLYRFHINGIVVSMLLGPGAKDIFNFEASMVAIFVIKGLIFTSLFIATGLAVLKFEKKINIRKLPVILTLIAITLVAQGLNVYAQAVRHSLCIDCCENLPHYYPLSANRKLEKWGIINTSNRPQINLSSGKLKYPYKEPSFADPDTLYNFLWIMIDSWNVRSFDEETTPAIYNFSKHCDVYKNHKSSSNGTISSIFGIFTGISDYFRTDFELSNCNPLLIDRLQTLDYNIQFYPSASLDNPPIARTLFSKIDNLRRETAKGNSYDNDCQIANDCCNFLEEASAQDKPFFAWCFFDMPHALFQPDGVDKKFEPAWNAADYTSLNNDLDPTEFWNLYRNNVYVADSLISSILSTLEKSGLMKNTVVMITGDHSQEFNENHKNFWGHNGNFSPSQIQIPMMIYYPTLTQPQQFSHLTTHYDVSYTMLSKFLGLTSNASDVCMGHLMSEPSDKQFFITGSKQNYALVSDEFIVEKRPGGNIKVTDQNLNPIDESNVDFGAISRYLTDLNMYYK